MRTGNATDRKSKGDKQRKCIKTCVIAFVIVSFALHLLILVELHLSNNNLNNNLIINNTSKNANMHAFISDLFSSDEFPKPLKLPIVNLNDLETPYYIIQRDNNSIDYYSDLVFGLGNLLAQYWLSVSFAYFNHLKWNLVTPKTLIQIVNHSEYHGYGTSDKYLKYFWGNCSEYCLWSNYLPKQYNFEDRNNWNSEPDDTNFSIANLFNIYIDTMVKHGYHDLKFPFWQKILLFVIINEPPFLKDVLINSTQNAFKMTESNKMKIADNVVVIHYRCGDLLAGNAGPNYGLFGISVIEQALTHWNLFQNNKTLYFITSGNDECEWLIHKIVDYMKQQDQYNAFGFEVSIDGSVNVDMYKIANGKYVICGYSTFCYYAAFANPNYVAFIHIIENINFEVYIEENVVSKKYLPILSCTKTKWDEQICKNVNFLTLKDENYTLNQIFNFVISH